MPDSIELKLEGLRSEVNTRFSEVRTDIRELTLALRELIRLDGDIKRIQETCTRLSVIVDRHDLDIGVLKIAASTSGVSVQWHDKWLWAGVSFISVLLSAITTALIVKNFI